MDLSTAQECRGAVNYAKSFNGDAYFYKVVSWPARHIGCSVYDDGRVLFSTHPTGDNFEHTRSICHIGNY